jgi:hypothetical protein
MKAGVSVPVGPRVGPLPLVPVALFLVCVRRVHQTVDALSPRAVRSDLLLRQRCASSSGHRIVARASNDGHRQWNVITNPESLVNASRPAALQS